MAGRGPCPRRGTNVPNNRQTTMPTAAIRMVTMTLTPSCPKGGRNLERPNPAPGVHLVRPPRKLLLKDRYIGLSSTIVGPHQRCNLDTGNLETGKGKETT